MTAGLILGLALAGALPAGTPQAQPPVFRAEAYVVVFKVSALKPSGFGRPKPEARLTVDLRKSRPPRVFGRYRLRPIFAFAA